MKKVLVVINNFHIGGVQKSVLGYVKKLGEKSDVTLVAMSKQGALLEWIPEGISIAETKSLYRYFGKAQRDCKTFKDKLIRGTMVVLARCFGSKIIRFVADHTIENLGRFDEIVSYHHPGRNSAIYGGTAEYALAYAKKHPAKTVCFVHCDYCRSQLNQSQSKKLFERFYQINCVSQGTKQSFLKAFETEKIRHAIASKTVVEYNTVDEKMIRKLADETENIFAIDQKTNGPVMVSVARLGQEKGILRFVKLLAEVKDADFCYVIVGDGQERAQIEAEICSNELKDKVILVGETINPYPYMKQADILVVPSYHEAAPLVFQEAEALGLPVFTTRTLSADEMVKNGWIVENEDEAIRSTLKEILTFWKKEN